jgi:hypothetical protein
MTPGYPQQAPLIRAVRGPILLMVIGALFALDHFTEYQIGQTWPVLLIIAGVLMLLGRLSPSRAMVPLSQTREQPYRPDEGGPQ